MKSLHTLVALVGLFILGVPTLWAMQDSSQVVKVEGFPSLKPVHPEGIFTVAVRVHIEKGWHVNAHEGLLEYFIPIQLSDPPVNSAFRSKGIARYPLGEKKALGGATQAFSVYEGDQILYLDVELEKGAKPGILTLPLSLRLQACNDQVCLSPATIPVTVKVEVGDLKSPVAPFHPEMFQGTLASQSAPDASENIIAKYIRNNGILLTFVLIFLGGLALNLTPCVYPMIPLTISYFGNQKAEKPGVILGRAVAYVVGISITYSSLGVTAALTGKILGSSLQSPIVLMVISLVLVVLSLSMFGLYEIQAPAWLLNKIASSSTQGWLGALGMGLVFGIVAAPCVDPFSIGLLTFVAAKANPYLGFIMFFTLSLGLGFPYIWLGFFSNEIQRLPRSGMWMVWVKKIFGMILLGMPLYFLNPMMPKGLNAVLVPSYLALCGVLLGFVFSGKGVTPGFKGFQRFFGAALLVLGFVVHQAWPKPVELPFVPYDPALLAQAQKEGKPVFIDFSANWCLPCKELEIKTFSDPRIHKALESWVLLKADLTEFSSGPVEELKKTYGIMGVPTLVFIGPDGKEIKELRTVGFEAVDEFMKKLWNYGPGPRT